jgi:hypothetical protein
MITLHLNPVGKPKDIYNRDFSNVHPYLNFKLCPHQHRYPFKNKSPLKDYLLHHCQGFVPSSDDRYTINYIAVVIIKNCEELNLLKIRGSRIHATSFLKKAFKTTNTYLKLTEIRRRIVSQLEAEAEELYIYFNQYSYFYPIWCADPRKFGLNSNIRPFLRCP